MLQEILEQYPKSDLHKYGELYEPHLRLDKGCYKITGTIDQVKYQVTLLLKRNEQ